VMLAASNERANITNYCSSFEGECRDYALRD